MPQDFVTPVAGVERVAKAAAAELAALGLPAHDCGSGAGAARSVAEACLRRIVRDAQETVTLLDPMRVPYRH